MEKNIFLIIALFAVLSLAIFFSESTITGYDPKDFNVKYVTCRYLDFDNHGRCVRLEKQLGVQCNPQETIYPYQQEYGTGTPGDEQWSWGWFIRPCQLPEETKRF